MNVIWARVHPVFKMPCNAMLLPGTFISVSIWKWSHGDFLFTELPLGLWCYFYRIVHRLFSYGQRCYHRPANELHHSTGHTSVPRTWQSPSRTILQPRKAGCTHQCHRGGLACVSWHLVLLPNNHAYYTSKHELCFSCERWTDWLCACLGVHDNAGCVPGSANWSWPSWSKTICCYWEEWQGFLFDGKSMDGVVSKSMEQDNKVDLSWYASLLKSQVYEAIWMSAWCFHW